MNNMERCPQCKRFGVEYDPSTGAQRCLWRDCLWVNRNNIDLDNVKYKPPSKFKEFIKAMKKV